MNAVLLVAFGAASVRIATPLALAAIGESVAERGGAINLGIEGAMLAGAFVAALGATAGGIAAGVAGGTAAGTVVALAFAAIAIWARTDQIIAGMAVTLGAGGFAGVLAYRVWGVSGAGLSVPTIPPVPIPVLSSIPWLGGILFDQSPLTYAAYVMIPAASWLLFRTRFGLQLRASGEAPDEAAASGVAVRRVRTIGVLIGGACAGVAGASLVLAQVGTFSDQMTAGRGFIALAIVALGRWHPWGVGAASLLFGGATALQYLFQAAGTTAPYQLFLALPYLLALVVLAAATRRRRGPAALGRTY